MQEIKNKKEINRWAEEKGVDVLDIKYDGEEYDVNYIKGGKRGYAALVYYYYDDLDEMIEKDALYCVSQAMEDCPEYKDMVLEMLNSVLDFSNIREKRSTQEVLGFETQDAFYFEDFVVYEKRY